jgi:DHA1 family bicyclomycin/chloramphenicol resistance-like MFS transporter
MNHAAERKRIGPLGRSQVGLATVLALLAMLSPFSIDTFLPSLRAMQAEFAVSAFTIQHLLTAYMVPYAAMSLVHGSLSDAIGRRAVVIGGLSVYLLASLGCVFAPSFGSVIAFRAVQGLTAGVGIIVGRAVIRDLYEGRDAQRLMSAVTMLFGIAPAAAPVIGGWVHIAFGWRAVFAFLALLCILMLVLSHFALPETHPREKRTPLRPADLARTAVLIGQSHLFLWLALCNGALFATLWIYIGAAPAIVMGGWGLTESDFGALFFPFIGGYVFGALCSGSMAGRVRPDAQLFAGLSISAVAATMGCALGAALDTVPIVAQQLVIGATAAGAQLGAPVLTLKALDLYPAYRGSVSSLLAFVQLTGASIVLAVAPLIQRNLSMINFFSLGSALLAIACARRALKAT